MVQAKSRASHRSAMLMPQVKIKRTRLSNLHESISSNALLNQSYPKLRKKSPRLGKSLTQADLSGIKEVPRDKVSDREKSPRSGKRNLPEVKDRALKRNAQRIKRISKHGGDPQDARMVHS